jgi:hypothetical protein
MTNEQCNALTNAIITGFTILAKAHMNAINASHSRQGAFLNTINEDPNCCALPIEPPASVEVEGPGAGYRWLLIGELCQKGDQYHDGDGWGNTYRTTPVPRARQYRRKIAAKDGEA